MTDSEDMMIDLALDYDDFPTACERCGVTFVEGVPIKLDGGLIVHAVCPWAGEVTGDSD